MRERLLVRPTSTLIPAAVFVPAALAVTLAACGPQIQSARFEDVPPRPPDQDVRVFSSRLPQCPYEEVGVVSGKARFQWTSMDEVLDALRGRARIMGGDAIVGVGMGETVSGGSVVGESVSINTAGVLSGTVVRFTDPDCRS